MTCTAKLCVCRGTQYLPDSTNGELSIQAEHGEQGFLRYNYNVGSQGKKKERHYFGYQNKLENGLMDLGF